MASTFNFGAFVIYSNKVTGRQHHGRVSSIDTDNKYCHLRTTTGDLEYVEVKNVREANERKMNNINKLMSNRIYADGRTYDAEF